MKNFWVRAASAVVYVALFLGCIYSGDLTGNKLLGGVILAAFLFGFPAGETVLPLVLLGYMGTSALPEAGGGLFALLSAHGWTRATALSFLVFTMFHFPCAPTLLALWRETKSPKLLLLSVAVPLAAGLSLSFLAARLPL